jgi:AcrR family transcriptional regulator
MAEAAKEIQRFGIENFDVQRVMDRAKATNGSLYHHFGSKNGLIAAAEVQELVRHLQNDNQVFREMVEGCASKKQFADALELLVSAVASSTRTGVRMWRVRALASALDNKAVAKIVRTAQIEGAMHGAESLAIARDRGLIKPAADLEALSYWLQGQFFGFILLETAEKERLRDEWKRASLAGISAALGL